MKSTKPKKPFTLDDFEKGLMLAGIISPASVSDLRQREAVEELDKEDSEEKKQLYFKRVVLAAEIASKLHQEPTLGRVKFQKLVYLCEHAAKMELQHRYQKQTAGPFDNKFMHSIAKELKRNKWFSVEEKISNGIKRSQYVPLTNANGYKRYYQSYFSKDDQSIQTVIELFRRISSSDTELAATVHACIQELVENGQPVTLKALTTLFYAWSKAKIKFTEQQIIDSAVWLKKIGFIQQDIL